MILLFVIPACFAQDRTGSISGKITDFRGAIVVNANIELLSTTRGAVSDTSGIFRLHNVNPGWVRLRITCMGYKPQVKPILVQSSNVTEVTIKLDEHVLLMQDVVVTPGNFSIAHKQSATKQSIAKERLSAVPATLDDIYRVLHIMPGVSFSDDFSAHFSVRGGKQSENLILLDGMEIFDPYHLKDIGGAVGVMNMDVVDNMAIMTGGFEAKYGDRLSSVVSIINRKCKAERLSGILGAGGTGFSLLLESPIPLGSCIVSFRKSFLKEAAEILNPTDYTFSPSFYDVQSKISLWANRNHQIHFNLLYSKDNSYLEKWRQDSELYADYGNSYQGLVWQSTWNSKMSSECIVSRGHNFWDNRVGDIQNEKLNLVEQVFSYNVNTLFPSHEIETGLTFKHIHYSYEFESTERPQDQQEFDDVVHMFLNSQRISPQTYKGAAYIQDKFRVWQPLFVNAGLRFDYFDYNENHQVSPRLGISYHFKNKTILRAAWGHYYQAPIYTELTNKRGAAFNPKASQAIHYILGVEHFFSDKLNIRIEAYVKTLQQMIGHYVVLGDPPQLKYGNPNSGECRGIEFFVNGNLTRNISIWATYAYSRAMIDAYFLNWRRLNLHQQTVPRSTDQPHNISLFVNYKLKSWEFNLKWRYLSGIPYTPMQPHFESEPLWIPSDFYSARYPAYHRLDVRLGKTFTFRYFRLAAFLEIKNCYNRKNVLMYDYQFEHGQPVRKTFYTLPLLPTIEFKLLF